MPIRHVKLEDSERLLALFTALDNESNFMLLEPGERDTSLGLQQKHTLSFIDSRQQAMLVAEADDGEIIGFTVGTGGKCNRNRHSMYCIIGIRKAHQAKGIGTQLLTALQTWAQAHEFQRIELTVMEHNTAAIKLYTKLGFEREGMARNAIKVEGELINLIYMAKLLAPE